MRTFRCALACAGALSLIVSIPSVSTAAEAGSTPAAEAHNITLITGDRVQLSVHGGQQDVVVTPGAGREKIQFLQRTDNGHVTVTPSDAVRGISTGRLDARLFDITELVKQKVDDASRADVPLIISGVTGPGVQVARALPSINGAAVTANKKTTAEFWSTVVNGTAKVWLDGKREVLDDVSNAQIGVPTAWQAGLKGKDVAVAVLDTGIDVNHPDLAGAVLATKDFTNSENGVADSVGHGTHVAATIMGTGAASAGKYAGVAPEAKVLMGKVCPNASCPESAILAGMQWAAAEQKARIVSLSLGGVDTPGIDPLEEAVNNLTASTGALFVIAAGNSGPTARSVSSPSTADAALSVASVNKQDVLSRFSGRGPRVGDAGLKPEVAAPGEAIISARAAGTTMGTPIDDNYVAANGTSMATPHVSGAAAILAQAHPDWTATELKSALASSAKPINATSFEQGAGRVDVARAVTQSIFATPTVGFGVVSAPFASQPPVTKQVTYRNGSDTAVTLNLAATSTAPANAFAVDAAQVTVPAKGQANVGLTLTPAALSANAFGSFSGRVTASTQDGATVAQTAFGAMTEPESFNVNVTFIDRDGKPGADTLPQILTTTALERVAITPPVNSVVSGGKLTLRLARGTYAFDGRISTAEAGSDELGSLTNVVIPMVTVDREVNLVFDARKGNLVQFRLDRPVDHHSTWITSRYTVDQGGGTLVPSINRAAVGLVDIYVAPVQADPARFIFGLQDVELSPANARESYIYNLTVAEPGRVPANVTYRFADRQLGRIDARYRAQGVAGMVTDRADLPDFLPEQTSRTSFNITLPLPTRRTEFYTAAPAAKFTQFMSQRRPEDPSSIFGLTLTDATPFAAGSRAPQNWNSAVIGPQISAHFAGHGIGRNGNRIIANISVVNPADPGTGGLTLLANANGTMSLSRDGQVISTSPFPDFGGFTLPADEGTYTLTSSATRSVPWATLSTKVDASWTFKSAPTAAFGYLPLPTATVTGNFDDLNQAPALSLFGLRIAAGTQAGAAESKITNVALDYSSDDGVTWKKGLVRKLGSGWEAIVFNPRIEDSAAGFMSIRVKATAENGNTVEQTVIRAYGLAKRY